MPKPINRPNVKLSTTIQPSFGLEGHYYLGALDPTDQFYIHYIPKNASSYIRSILSYDSWQELSSLEYLYSRQYPRASLCLIRDPYERWISGITEFLFEAFRDLSVLENHWEAIIRIISLNPVMDSHTESQSRFLERMDLDYFDFIYVKDFDSTKNSLHSWQSMHSLDLSGIDKVNLANASSQHSKKKQINDFLKKILAENKNIEQSIKDYYNVDYKLIDWITANKKWIQ